MQLRRCFRRSGALSGALFLLLAAALMLVAGGSKASAAGDPSGSDLLAADNTLAEVQQQIAGNWTPWYPIFEAPPGIERKSHASGWVRSTEQEYRRYAATGQDGVVYSRVDLYKDEASAKAAYAGLKDADSDGTKVLAGVATVGDEQRAFTYEYAVANAPEDAYRFETFIRARQGRALVLVDMQLPEYLSAAKLGALAAPVATRAAQVLAGSLTAPALPAALASVAPPASLTTIIGPMLGQAPISVETFAGGFEAPGELARDKTFGITVVGFQTYALSAKAGHIIEVSIIPAKDEASARQFVLTDADGTPSKNTLASGATGNISIFRSFSDYNNYDYQFARNKYAVILKCTPFTNDMGDVSPSCEVVTRKAAEAIYAILPADVSATPTAPPRTTPTPAATATPSPVPATTTPAATQTAQSPTTAPAPPRTGSGSDERGTSTPPLLAGLAIALLGAVTLGASLRRR